MQKICPHQWQPGMVLALQVVNNIGVPLAPAGAELNENLIKQFLRFGIDSIAVEGEPENSQEPDPSLEIELKKLDERFIRVQEHPLMMRIKKLFIQSLHKRNGIN